MQATESVKVPDGKLVQVTVTADDRIDAVQITGDFFLQPPEALEDLEAAIEGHPVDVDVETLRDAIAEVEADLIGFTATDLAEVTVEALR